jgi:hypothetical protein
MLKKLNIVVAILLLVSTACTAQKKMKLSKTLQMPENSIKYR